MNRWTLPEFFEDILPPDALRIEALRRRLLDLCSTHGYLLVQPPLLEHIESLLTGTAQDLDLCTFKVVDQLSGRLLGLRADITPQVARIDAHLLHRRGVTRLCYAGSVLQTRPSGLHQSREVTQIGAELYGHSGIEADAEVILLMLKALQAADLNPLHLDLAHVGIFRSLVTAAQLSLEEEPLFDALQGKDLETVHQLTQHLPPLMAEGFRALLSLYGDVSPTLAKAHQVLPPLPGVQQALADLTQLTALVAAAADSVQLDLADLRGYHYHTGVTFSVFTPGATTHVGRGGRYDEMGKAFGCARPATGFSLDLRQLARLAPVNPEPKAIFAPHGSGAELAKKVANLRESGKIVVVGLPGETGDPHHYEGMLSLQDGRWQVTDFSHAQVGS